MPAFILSDKKMAKLKKQTKNTKILEFKAVSSKSPDCDWCIKPAL